MRNQKLFLSIILTFLLTLSVVQSATAANVAMVVANSLSLDVTHEKKIFNLLNQSGHSITLVDKNSNVDYHSFDLIVVAGRPRPGIMLDSFVANIPVNKVPTIAIDQGYPDDWGWVRPAGLSLLTSSRMQDVVVQRSHPLLSPYVPGDKIIVHIVFGTQLVDMVRWHTNFTIVGSSDSSGDLGLVAYAGPGTNLALGKSISSNSAAVFLGLAYPIYWTEDAEKIFLNSVNWLTKDSDGDGLKDFQDNCANVPNPDQLDIDNDKIGNACDSVDDRADLIIDEISLPSIRNQCEQVSVRFSVKNIGLHPATKYRVEMNMENTGITAVSTINLNPGDTASYRFILSEESTCGTPVKIISVSVKDVEPGETDTSNNEKSVILVFNRVKMDVDNDTKLEVAHDRNDNSTDGYEDYSDPNDNTNVTIIDGDLDYAVDYLIDVLKDGDFDKYWDPDEGILTDVFYNNTSVMIDVNGDSTTDVIYNTTDGTLTYLDLVPPIIGAIEVSPTFDGKTWTTFNISAPVSDSWTGIHPYSCEYALDNLNWSPGQYASGKCFKNGLTANVGTNLLINFNVRDKAGNTANGTAVSRTVSTRPLSITINKDSVSYLPNDTVKINGLISYADNGQKISSAVTYSLGGASISGSTLSNSSGYYSFNFIAPTFGLYVLTVSASAQDASGSATASVDVGGAPVQASSGGGGGGSSAVTLLRITSPQSLRVYSGDQAQFEVTVRNAGNVLLRNVKLYVQSDIYNDVSNTSVDLMPAVSKTFMVVFKTSDSMIGSHQFILKANSTETYDSSVTNLIVDKREVLIPVVELTKIDLPEFFQNKKDMVNVTLLNSGNASTDVQVSLDVPNSWSVVTDSERIDLDAGQTQTIPFEVTPGNVDGELVFTVDYLANGEDVYYQNRTSVTANKELFNISEITGFMSAVIVNPIFYIPASIIVGIILYKFLIHDKLGMLRTQSKPKPTPRNRYIPNYDAWEENYRRKLD